VEIESFREISQERLTRGTVTSKIRRAAHPSGCAKCGAGAGCSSTECQSLRGPFAKLCHPRNFRESRIAFSLPHSAMAPHTVDFEAFIPPQMHGATRRPVCKSQQRPEASRVIDFGDPFEAARWRSKALFPLNSRVLRDQMRTT